MDSSEVSLKSSKKRKKYAAGNSLNNTSKQKKCFKKSDGSREFITKTSFVNENLKSKESSTANFQNSDKYEKFEKPFNIKKAKKLKKKMLKAADKAVSKPQSLTQSKHPQKSKKNKKVKNASGVILKSSPSVSKNSSSSISSKKVKKGKEKLKSNLEENIVSESDNELSEFCISDDNESDEEVLREEIQNSLIFKQIGKLMKKAPHLNPANATLESSQALNDENEDDSSDLSLSDDEESVMESDNVDDNSPESDSEESKLKNKTMNKKQNGPKKQVDKNTVFGNKKTNFTENVIENTGFDRTSKNTTLKRTISDKDKKGQMSSNLKNKVQEKLAGAKFRFLNEKLYTETGKEAFQYFQENTVEFDDYHSGYRLQVSKWPMNPVNEIIADIQKLKKSFVIADLGCGEAKIAQTFPDRTIHSFDLVPLNEFVKACDISKISLPNESADVAVFCLSLMGTNLKDYLCEAFRILKVGGILKIAEVESRIENLGHFINYLKSIGFALERKNTKHKMFVFLDLKKEKQKCNTGKVSSLSLRPCLYKKR